MESRNSYSTTISDDFNEKSIRKISQANILEDNTKFTLYGKKNFIRFWKRKLWPPRGWPIKYLTWSLVLAAFLAALWSIFPGQMQPQKSLFGLIITILLSIAAEKLVVKIPTPPKFPPFPPLLASLLMGLMLRNLPYPGNIAASIDTESSSILRTIALTIILTRAGLEIEPEAIRKVKWAVMRLAFMPCTVETCCIGVFANLILNFPFIWSFMLGFVIAAVSPAVVVPSLIILQDDGLGVDKGVPSLVMAASGIDDVLAITGFTILLGIALPSQEASNFFSKIRNLIYPPPPLTPEATTLVATLATTQEFLLNSTLANSSNSNSTLMDSDNSLSEASHIGEEIGVAVFEVFAGIIWGVLFGLLVSYLPHKKMKYKNFCRGFLLLSIGTFMVFATSIWGIAGAGTLCALVMSFTASLKWKDEAKPLAHAWEYMWVLFQPILFGLTGALVDVSKMDATTVGLGLAVLTIGLVARLLTSTAATFGLNYNWKEKIFVSIAWIPKGTVQAALGSAALETAIKLEKSKNEILWGTQILSLAVLITLITAPLGSFGISLSGPRLLASGGKSDVEVQKNELSETIDSTKNVKGYNSAASFDSGVDLKVVGSSITHNNKHFGESNYSYQHDCELQSSTKF